MQAITEAMTRTEIRRTLKSLSSDLSQALEDTLQRIQKAPKSRQQVAKDALMWVSRVRRPLLITELCHLLAVNPGDLTLDEDSILQPKVIVESCLGLVIVDDESATVGLVHYALQEYLRERRPGFPSPQEIESHITKVLLTYLTLHEAGDSFEISEDPDHQGLESPPGRLYPSLLDYAAGHWGHHAQLTSVSQYEAEALVYLKSSRYIVRPMQSPTLTERVVRNHVTSHMKAGKQSKISVSGRTGLHVTAEFGLVDLMEILLRDGLNINARDYNGNTSLHEAVIKGQRAAVRRLVDRFAEVDVYNGDSNTPLYLAVVRSDHEMVEVFLEAGADSEVSCMDGWSPLHKAADNGDVRTASLLLTRQASVVNASMRGLVALHRAAGRGHLAMMHTLINAGTPVDVMTFDQWTPLHGASSSGMHEAVKLLLDLGAEVNKLSLDKRSPLHRSCRGGHYLTTLALLNEGADPLIRDPGGSLPLHRAAKGGHEKVVELLTNHDPSLATLQLNSSTDCVRTPREEALYSGHWGVAVVLQQREAAFAGDDSPTKTEIERAVIEHDLPRLAVLLSEGVNVNEQNSDGFSPLHLALLLEDEAIAERLLLHGTADIHLRTGAGWQALHCAAKIGNEHLASICIDKGADVKARTRDKQTPLHKACKSGSVDTVRLLIEHGANIEAPDQWGWRPLHSAAGAGSMAIVKFLIANDAILHAQTLDLKSVQACASSQGQHALVEYLRQQRYVASGPLDAQMYQGRGYTAVHQRQFLRTWTP